MNENLRHNVTINSDWRPSMQLKVANNKNYNDNITTFWKLATNTSYENARREMIFLSAFSWTNYMTNWMSLELIWCDPIKKSYFGVHNFDLKKIWGWARTGLRTTNKKTKNIESCKVAYGLPKALHMRHPRSQNPRPDVLADAPRTILLREYMVRKSGRGVSFLFWVDYFSESNFN